MPKSLLIVLYALVAIRSLLALARRWAPGLLIALCSLMLFSVSSSYININADSYAGIRLGESVYNGVGITGLKFARIPSLIPDIGILTILSYFHSNEIIYRLYGLIKISALVALGWEYSYQALRGIVGRSIIALFLSASFTGFSRYSPIYREAIGIYMTPMHHGGNILNTLIFGLLLVIIRRRSCLGKSNTLTSSFLVLLTTLSLISNRLFIFTAILPFAVLISRDFEIRHAFCLFIRDLRSRSKCAWLALICSLTLLALFLFKATIQCRPLIGVDFLGTSVSVLRFSKEYPVVITPFLVCLLLLLIYFSRSVQKKLRSRDRNCGGWITSESYLLLSTMSWTTYIFFLSSGPAIEKRYMLPGLIFIPIIIVILAARVIVELEDIRYLKFLALTLAAVLVGFVTLKQVSTKSIFSPNYSLLDQRKRSYEREYITLRTRRLKYGFSEFWSVELGLAYDGDLAMLPVLHNGLPDLWAYSIQDFRGIIRSVEEERGAVFYYSSSGSLPAGVWRRWGEPDEVISIKKNHQEATSIYIYQNDQKVSRILSEMRLKLDKYVQSCKRGASFMER